MALATLRLASSAACPGGSPERSAAPEAAPPVEEVRRAVAAAAARDWLETQARVVEYWRDLLADAGAADELVEALDVHAAFLNGVAARG